ncbi:MAG: T9SS type A sorting domain-containing protein [Candidatus Fonsibacter sp.]
MRIFDVTGKECRNLQNIMGLTCLNLSSLPDGVYTLMMKGENMWETIKLLKE